MNPVPGGGHEDDILATGAAVEILAQHQVRAPRRRTVRLQVVAPARNYRVRTLANARRKFPPPHQKVALKSENLCHNLT